jgi:hypothetical protein
MHRGCGMVSELRIRPVRVRPDEGFLGWLLGSRIEIAAVVAESTGHGEVSCGHFGVLRDTAGQSSGMGYTVSLAQTSGEGGQSDSARLEEDHEESATLGEMGLGEMKYFPLLLAEGERGEGALVAVADGEAREESFDMG